MSSEKATSSHPPSERSVKFAFRETKPQVSKDIRFIQDFVVYGCGVYHMGYKTTIHQNCLNCTLAVLAHDEMTRVTQDTLDAIAVYEKDLKTVSTNNRIILREV